MEAWKIVILVGAVLFLGSIGFLVIGRTSPTLYIIIGVSLILLLLGMILWGLSESEKGAKYVVNIPKKAL